MKVSLIQMDSRDDKERNFLKSLDFLRQALTNKPNIICLSERFLYWGDKKTEESENIDSEKIIFFQKFAKENKVNIILGSVSLKTENPNKTTNTSLIINKQGKIIHRYDKIYMYEVNRNDLKIDENKTTQKGQSLGIFEIDGIKIGIGICFDLRFPEYFRALVSKGAEIIFLPANMRKATGETAWDILTKARAIENQVYFCACNQTGETGPKERCGNTRIVSFNGKIIKEIKSEEGIISADLNLETLKQFRSEFPVLKQMKKYDR